MQRFDYDEAFSRNIGWVTEWEQQMLRGKRIAIAGMGGVGGVHLLTLTRLGVGAFHISDMDTYEVANFNRQVGASLSTVGRHKAEAMADLARDINPELDIRLFAQGIDEHNIDAFLDGVDLFVDGFDFFVIDIRARVFARCAERGIPAITAGPIGMGTPYLSFLPGGMTFEDYFCLEGLPTAHKYVNFLAGLTPKGVHRKYLVDPTRLNLAARRGPSTAMACQLASGVLGTEALKILLNRGPVYPAPHYHLFDAYLGRWVRGRLPGGNRNPLQRLKLRLGYRMVDRMLNTPCAAPAAEPRPRGDMERILELARWAPSGDNSQPWRFEVRGEDRVDIHLQDHAGSNVYEYNGAQPTFLSAGFLLETLAIAASGLGRALEWTYRSMDEHRHLLETALPTAPQVLRDPLSDFIKTRSVDRRRYRTTPLTEAQRQALAACLGDELEIHWFEAPDQRRRVIRLNAMATDIRLSIPEAFDVHRQILHWGPGDSAEGIPASATGLDPMTLKIMNWVMEDWSRASFMNRFLGGTVAPRLQMDWLPGMACAAHFAISRKTPAPGPGHDGRLPAAEVAFLLRSGRALQRLWLTATRLGLAMQPGLAPLCFGWYGKHGIGFTQDPAARRKAADLSQRLARLVPGHDADSLLFMARVGWPLDRSARPRSARRPLDELMRLSTAAG